jgi:uncharacterized protein
MNEAQNVEVVKNAYAAFQRGDIAAILASLDPGIVWRGVIGAGPHVPMAGERHGTAEVAAFFKTVGENVRFSQFEPRQFLAQGDRVVTLGHYRGTAPSGGSFDSDFVMVFTVRNGKVTEFQEFLDSSQLNAAFAGAHTAA